MNTQSGLLLYGCSQITEFCFTLEICMFLIYLRWMEWWLWVINLEVCERSGRDLPRRTQENISARLACPMSRFKPETSVAWRGTASHTHPDANSFVRNQNTITKQALDMESLHSTYSAFLPRKVPYSYNRSRNHLPLRHQSFHLHLHKIRLWTAPWTNTIKTRIVLEKM